MPEDDCGISSNITVLSIPFTSKTLKLVDVSLFVIVPRFKGALKSIA